MHLRFRTPSSKRNCSTFHRGLSLLIIFLLLGGTVAGQDTNKTQADAAASLMAEALQLVIEGSPVSLRKALEKIESATSLLHSLNVPEGEAAMLSLAGSTYQRLDQNDKAIEKYEQARSIFHAAGNSRGEALVFLQL